MSEKQEQLQQSFDTLLKEHQRVLARFVALRNASAPIASTFEAYQEYLDRASEGGFPGMSFGEWAHKRLDDKSLHNNLARLMNEYHKTD